MQVHSSMENKIKILYVDDEVNNLNSFKATFRRDYDIKTAESGDEAIALVKENDFNVIITDQRMPNMTGVEFLEKIIPDHPEPMRILLTGYTDITAVVDAVNKGKIYHYITKPWEESALKIVIKNAFEVFDLRRRNEKLTDDLKKANVQLEFLLRQNLIS